MSSLSCISRSGDSSSIRIRCASFRTGDPPTDVAGRIGAGTAFYAGRFPAVRLARSRGSWRGPCRTKPAATVSRGPSRCGSVAMAKGGHFAVTAHLGAVGRRMGCEDVGIGAAPLQHAVRAGQPAHDADGLIEAGPEGTAPGGAGVARKTRGFFGGMGEEVVRTGPLRCHGGSSLEKRRLQAKQGFGHDRSG